LGTTGHNWVANLNTTASSIKNTINNKQQKQPKSTKKQQTTNNNQQQPTGNNNKPTLPNNSVQLLDSKFGIRH